MSGRSGQITLRLPYAVKVDAMTIDHIPISLTSAIGDANTSAPRFVRMIGYPPCHDDNDEECALIGFDVSKPLDLGHFEYKLPDLTQYDDGDDEEKSYAWVGSVQTFTLGEVATVKADKTKVDPFEDYTDYNDYDNEKIKEEEEDDDPTMCSMTKPSCGGEVLDDENNDYDDVDLHTVEGVTLIVEENWGNPDYTCIYRFRVHGVVAE
mmetsp:Transcript_36485/g.55802  ORF Transcript_36485/g.55802 Transcript_36485/m.55802 type:complete len:208 (-) Transcript_36485:33-656(-)